MRIYIQKEKSNRNSSDVYFGEYGEINLSISSVRFEDEGVHDDVLHYHKEAEEYYITHEGIAILEIEGQEVLLQPERVVMVAPGEKHRIKAIRQAPCSIYVIASKKDEGDKVIVG